MKIKMHTYKKALEIGRQNCSSVNVSEANLVDYLPTNVFGRTHEVLEYFDASRAYSVKVNGTVWVVDPMFVKEVIRG